MTSARVLQVLADTDADATGRAALDRHRGLSARGFEVRTLALAPGRRGGLEQDVPTMAPSQRSFAARGVMSNERRWADVVVLCGPRTLGAATVPPRVSAVPTVLALDPSHDGVSLGGRGPLTARILRRLAMVVADPSTGNSHVDDRVDTDRLAVLSAELDPIEQWPGLLQRVLDAAAATTDDRTGA